MSMIMPDYLCVCGSYTPWSSWPACVHCGAPDRIGLMSRVNVACRCGKSTGYYELPLPNPLLTCTICGTLLLPITISTAIVYPVDPDRPTPLLPCLDRSGTLIVIGDKVKSIYPEPVLSGRVEKTDGCTITVRVQWVGSTRVEDKLQRLESGTGRGWEVMR